MSTDDTWTDAKVQIMRPLWDEGVATSEIARRVGMTNNAVVGKINRLGWPRRPSPIKARHRRPVVTIAAATIADTARNGCRMPLWPDDARPGHPRWGIYCDAPALAGKSWCARCHARVFVKVDARSSVFVPGMGRLKLAVATAHV